MLDYRLTTFLTLCECRNYTKTAKELHITQPAVTQHIQSLEEKYDTKLFQHQGKTFSLTAEGELLCRYARRVRAESSKIEEALEHGVEKVRPMVFGATLTIGEFVMPRILASYLKEFPDLPVTMLVENTESLLHRLDLGQIDFALVEGHFRKSEYESRLLYREPFLLAASPSMQLPPLSDIQDLCRLPLITRERGSGTRDILEQALYRYNLVLRDFDRVYELGNFKAMKELAEQGIGILGVYQSVVQQEFGELKLVPVPIKNFHVEGEFNFIFLKNSLFQEQYLKFYSYIKNNS